ncbi:MAG: hypothetical protein ACRDJN_03400 [Chloroflexota bacterium]
MPTTDTPRNLLLASLDRRQLTGYRASRELAWVVFPPPREGEASLEVLHLPQRGRYRVISLDPRVASTSPATVLGEFKDSDAAAACVEAALSQASD